MATQVSFLTALGPNDPDDGDAGRQQRGMAIAAVVPIQKNRLGYQVPSQSGNGSYVVSVDDEPFCTCPDFEATPGTLQARLRGRVHHQARVSVDGSQHPRTRAGPGCPLAQTGRPTTSRRPTSRNCSGLCSVSCVPLSPNRHRPKDGPASPFPICCSPLALRSTAPCRDGEP